METISESLRSIRAAATLKRGEAFEERPAEEGGGGGGDASTTCRRDAKVDLGNPGA